MAKNITKPRPIFFFCKNDDFEHRLFPSIMNGVWINIWQIRPTEMHIVNTVPLWTAATNENINSMKNAGIVIKSRTSSIVKAGLKTISNLIVLKYAMIVVMIRINKTVHSKMLLIVILVFKYDLVRIWRKFNQYFSRIYINGSKQMKILTYFEIQRTSKWQKRWS